MFLLGAGITVNNANIKNSGVYGLGISTVNEVTLGGDITVTNNDFVGFVGFSDAQGKVHVTGNLISNNNFIGVAAFTQDLTVAVGSYSGKSGKSGGSGSLTACDNDVWDINNFVGINFEGSDYTCDMTKTFGPVPECKPCYPSCDESSASETSQAMAQETMGSFMAGNHPGAAVKPMLLPKGD